MYKRVICAVAATVAFSGLALADGAKLFAEKTCTACHGKDGKTPLLPEYPKIAGQNAKYVERQMSDIKNGIRTNGNAAAMMGIMVIVSDAEISELANYVSKLTP